MNIIITKRCKESPFIEGLRCELLRTGNFEEVHNSHDGSGDIILKYDLKIKLASGMITYARSEWFNIKKKELLG